MKKTISLLLALCFLAITAVPVYAWFLKFSSNLRRTHIG